MQHRIAFRTAVFLASVLCLSVSTAAPAQTTSQRNVVSRPSPAAVRTLDDLNRVRVASLELDGVTSSVALTTLMKSTRLNYDFAPEFYRANYEIIGVQGKNTITKPSLNLPRRTITLRMQNVPLKKALDTLTRAIEIRWSADASDGIVTIHFEPTEKTRGQLPVPVGLAGGGFGGGGLGGGGFGGIGGGFQSGFGAGDLTAKRVNLDVHDTPIRTVLQQLFSQVKETDNNPQIEFAVDDDVPTTAMISLTCQNVAFKTALDALCQSAGIGYRTENVPKGFLVRLSKRYAPSP